MTVLPSYSTSSSQRKGHTPQEQKALREGDERLEATRRDFSSPEGGLWGRELCAQGEYPGMVLSSTQLPPEVLGRPDWNPQPGPYGLLAQSPQELSLLKTPAVRDAESPRTSVSGS